MKEQVAVYGTLRKGGGNERVLLEANGKHVGSFWTLRDFCMYDYGSFPAVALEGSESIFLEVYEVDDLGPTDQLEGYPHLYLRQQIPTPYGVAWIYYMERYQIDLTCPQVKSGDWLQYDVASQRSWI